MGILGMPIRSVLGECAIKAVEIRRGVSERHMPVLLDWANAGGPDFLKQFAGPKWRYPLTEAQVTAEAGSIFSILADGAFAGIVQALYRRESRAHIGRFLLDPGLRGTGIGERALRRFCAMLFEDEAIDAVSLNVYRFNVPAIRCYAKCGFGPVPEAGEGGPWDSCFMTLPKGVAL